jgi:hypothetical protein
MARQPLPGSADSRLPSLRRPLARVPTAGFMARDCPGHRMGRSSARLMEGDLVEVLLLTTLQIEDLLADLVALLQ